METALKIRNVLFKSFIISYALLIIVWLISLTGFYPYMVNLFYTFNEAELEKIIVFFLGIWEILSFIFFLFPAIAIHWEYVWKKNK